MAQPSDAFDFESAEDEMPGEPEDGHPDEGLEGPPEEGHRHLRGHAVSYPEEEIRHEDRDEWRRCEHGGDSQHIIADCDHSLPKGSQDILEEEGVDPGAWWDDVVGGGYGVEEELGATDGKEEDDEDVVVEQADRRGLLLEGRVEDKEAGRASLVVDEGS